jgi:hypothetical protein
MNARLIHALLLLAPATMAASDGDAGPDQYICSTFAVMQASPLDQGETGTWSVVSGAGTFSDANSPFAIVTGMAIGDNVYRWTVLNGGVPLVDQVLVSVFDPAFPGANAGADLTICTDTLTGVLSAAPVAFPVVGNWTVLSGDAVVAAPGLAQSVVTCSAAGSSVLLWTVFNGPCGETRDTVVVTVEDCQTQVAEVPAVPAARLRIDGSARTLIAEGQAGGELVLVDLTGRTVLRRSLADKAVHRIDLCALPPTVYLARIMGGAGTSYLRFSLAY